MERPNATADMTMPDANCKVTVIMSVPPAGFTMLYDDDVGFGRGTIFRQLDKPFLGRYFNKKEKNKNYHRHMQEMKNMQDSETMQEDV